MGSSATTNNFSVRVATKNGTGSQSSNNIIFRTLFRMGVGVNGKNLFPSNIQGLPTWFLIRASRENYACPVERHQVHILMNEATVEQDVALLQPGDACIYNSELPVNPELFTKPGIHWYPAPFDTLTKDNVKEAKLRGLLKNMVYVGVFADLFKLDMDIVKKAVTEVFPGKEKLWDLNFGTVMVGYNYSKEKLKKTDSYSYEKDKFNKTGEMLIEGNQATAFGAMMAGVSFVSWYPITPSSSCMESLISLLEKNKVDKTTKKKQFSVVQAEDELSSIGMALGAGWCGARSITATSGPGISLMAENYGFGYYAEVPCVLVDVQRVGPSTGLPTRTQQGDLTEVMYLSHGDTKQIMLFPADPKEAFELTYSAFDVTERMQQPVFVMCDLDLGMNNWIWKKFEYPTKAYDRGKVVKPDQLKSLPNWGRYEDIDGDGIAWRTLPGDSQPGASFFTRGSGHNSKARYTEDAQVYVNNLDRLAKKNETAKKYLPEPLFYGDKNSKIGILAVGTSHHAVIEAMDRLSGSGMKFRYCRPLSFPFHDSVKSFIDQCDRVYVIDQNRDGQLKTMLTQSFEGIDVKLKSVRYYGGLPLAAERVEHPIRQMAGKEM